jgi:hypothetical protein
MTVDPEVAVAVTPAAPTHSGASVAVR